jgi:hypothetical protein
MHQFIIKVLKKAGVIQLQSVMIEISTIIAKNAILILIFYQT